MPLTGKGGISKDILIGIAISSLFFAISVYLPIFGFFFSLFIPLPVLFYRLKLGRSSGAIVTAGSILVMGLILGRISIDVLFFTELLLLGFTLSECLELDLSVDRTILYTCAVVIAVGFLSLIGYSSMSATGLYDLLSRYVEKNLELTLVLYKHMGVSEESIHAISNSFDKLRYALVRIIPALIIASTLFVTWANLLIARAILTKRHLFFPDFGPLNRWKAPEILVWGIIASGLLILIPDRAIKMLGLNGLIVLMTIFFFQGIAVVSFYFEKKKFPPLLRVLLYTLISLQQLVLLIVVVFGFFDVWVDFRKLSAKK